ncbi:MAG: hypothetical protein ACLQEQ_09780 [Nitrososphaerales archaeon]
MAEEFFGIVYGGDFCWLGNGEPFNGQPCPKNLVADPILQFFSNLWARLDDFTATEWWGSRLYVVMMFITLIVSLAFFFLALRELDKRDSKPSSVAGHAQKSPVKLDRTQSHQVY